ncbi:hypothetical protein AMECASPLE_018643 [Ameca splendens]|uniref:Uncharacterized protein n=1 Tax=Ameca splendens TaxID=208324 RepID=A0ABV0XRR9_9TELE
MCFSSARRSGSWKQRLVGTKTEATMRSHEHSKRREEGNRVESLAESPLTFAGMLKFLGHPVESRLWLRVSEPAPDLQGVQSPSQRLHLLHRQTLLLRLPRPSPGH